MKKSDVLALAGVLLGLVIAAMLLQQKLAFYPYVVVEVPGGVNLTFLRQARPEPNACQFAAATVGDVVRAACPTCKVTVQDCLTRLNAEQQKLLSAQPVSFPTSTMLDGMVQYGSPDSADALAVCRETERQTVSQSQFRSVCYEPNSRRVVPVGSQPMNSSFAFAGFLLLLLSAVASCFVGYLVVRYDPLHANWTHDHTGSGPQKFHSVPTPRIGGLCVAVGLLVAFAALFGTNQYQDGEKFGYLLLSAMPAFVGGITEDVTKRVSVTTRLSLTMLAAVCATWMLGAAIPRLDVPGIDTLLLWMPMAIALTIFAVSGIANAINIIDGYNGLAAGFALIVLSAIVYVSVQVGDSFLCISGLALMGAVTGFLVWNYPGGKLFLGDGGAYLLGFWLAELSVLLVVRHPEVSPWFPMLLLVYPVMETLYSIYRRKIVRGHSPGRPDRLHLHQIVYMRLVRSHVGSSDPTLVTRRNSSVAPYIWAMTASMIAPALFFWGRTSWLAVACLAFCVAYVWLYTRMIRWRSPAWLIRRSAAKPPPLAQL